MDRCWDPLRKKMVALTPEEKVRQWFIAVLEKDCGVPEPLMMSEVGFTLGDKQYRADILVYDRSAAPLAVVECKRPDVEIDAKVADQALRYNATLGVRCIILTNGLKTFTFVRSDGAFVPCDGLISYDRMLCL